MYETRAHYNLSDSISSAMIPFRYNKALKTAYHIGHNYLLVGADMKLLQEHSRERRSPTRQLSSQNPYGLAWGK